MNKNLIIIIAVIIVMAAGVSFLLLRSTPTSNQTNQNTPAAQNNPSDSATPATSNKNISSNAEISVSEKPNVAKFEEYFKAIYLGKIPTGQPLDNVSAAPQASLSFTTGQDQLCTIVEPKKWIAPGTYASAIYNVNTKTYIKPKTTFPGEFEPILNAGCGPITASAGKYEYKAYINNALVMVLPFEIK